MAAQEFGDINVVFDNASETNPSKPYQVSTTIISGGALAPPAGEALKAIPFTGFWPFAGKRIVVLWSAAAADTVESEESAAEFPVLLLNEKTGRMEGTRVLSFETMTGFTAGGTVDVVNVVGVPIRLAYQDAPQGQIFALDPNKKLRVYMGDDT